MKRPFRSAVLPVVTMCLFAGACTAIEPLTEQGAAPAWVRDRLANDVEGRKAPPSVPVNEITAGDAARLDRDAAEVLRRRERQTAEIAAIEAEGRRAVDDFVADGRTRTSPPQ
ncbi:hypothetical protein [Maricaulis sp.]|uniref:hypothetical protein n=1 Tax=Maricaulis sp. TaxID=1486257 RepID=UPI003A8D84EA